MKVAILQTDIEWGRPSKNMLKASAMMAENPAHDLYILPEMWNTGFCVTPKELAESEATSPSLSWMKRTAAARQCAISGSILIHLPNNRYVNRHYFVNGRTGTVEHYDKYHLFTYGGEHKELSAGEQKKIIEFMGFRILLVTCYDLRFPSFMRYSDHEPYDMIICVANWPSSRQHAFDILLRARAIENVACVAAANRIGNDASCHYAGGSCIIDPFGKTLVSASPDTEMLISKEIFLDDIVSKRNKFPVLQDKDEISIKL